MAKNYNPQKIEKKWQNFWEKNKTFAARDFSEKEKFYILDMFPYPSGAGLHVGHPEGYTATDIVARFERARGKNVLHPMGWDAFGLPAENFALKTGTHPKITTAKNIQNFTRQIKSLGFSYDWDREIDTTDPAYFKWTQWIFLQFFEHYFDDEKKVARPISELIQKFEKDGTFAGKSKKEKSEILNRYRLAYESEMPINFCPSCKTGLANEEVVDGKCDRCGAVVSRKNLRQWVLRITKYADRLLNDLDLNTKKGERIPDESGGYSKGIHRSTLFNNSILPGRIFKVKKNARPRNFKLKNLFQKTENILFDGKKIWKHFREKPKKEIIFRCASAETIFRNLKNIEFHNISKSKKIGYLQIRKNIFRIILSKNAENIFEVKTFYRAKKLSKIFAESKKETLDWPEKIIAMQRNWIGKSSGAEVLFEIADTKKDGKIPDKSGCRSKGDHRTVFSSKKIFPKKIVEVNRIFEKNFRLSAFFEKTKNGEKTIFFDGKKLWRHFWKKTKNEKMFRQVFAKTVFSALSKIHFDENFIGYFSVKKSIFRVILEKTADGDFSVKTFCRLKNSEKYFPKTENISVFTTRPDTLFGATFLVVAPEHPMVKKIVSAAQKSAVEKYILNSAKKSDLERTDLAKEKTGVFTGAFAKNPVTGKKMPIWVADYVLPHYGTGAVMAVPAHDERDFEFATKYDLPIKRVFASPENHSEKLPFSGKNGVLSADIFSEIQNPKIVADFQKIIGKKSDEVIEKMIDFLEKNHLGTRKTNFKLRDWIFSRQRYWGEPIPIVHCEKCGAVASSPDFAKYYSDAQKKEARQKVISKVTAIASSCGNIFASSAEKVKWISEKIFFSECEVKTKIGKIKINRKNLQRHFAQKPRRERAFRWKLFPTVFAALPKINFEKCGDKKIGFFRAKNHFFCVVVKENELFTFYHSQKLSAVLKNLRKNFSLPLELPKVEKYEPSGTGESPLANISEFVETKCPECGEKAKRETNTMPQWAGSSWYYLRFMDPKNPDAFCDPKKENYWAPVDLYVGGAEHAVLHLLYARFWHKFLFDIGAVSTKEPFKKLMNQGLILAENGVKMSKSLGNVVNPDEIVKKYGADTLRVYEMFMGPFEQNKSWSTAAVAGIFKFLQKIWNLFSEKEIRDAEIPEFEKMTHQTIAKITADIENFKFNTAISQMMIFVNAAQKLDFFPRKSAEIFAKLIAPFAPHLAEEIWAERLKKSGGISFEKWPKFDPEKIRDDEIKMAVQINGKVRATISVAADADKNEILKIAKNHQNVAKFLTGKKILKEIFVPKKIINFVVK